MSQKKVLFILVLPFILSYAISFIISAHIYYQLSNQGVPSERIGLEIMKAMYTYSFYWSIIQICVGFYTIKAMGGTIKLREKYDIKRFQENLGKNLLIIVTLTAISFSLIMCFQLITAYLFYGDFNTYIQMWHSITQEIPLWAKIYMVTIAPLTAGIFEEVIWRWYGIEKLEEYRSTRTAVIIQAITFGIWHGLSLHTIATTLIGIIYGYVYTKRRHLLELSIAHILTDIIGSSVAFFLM